MENIEKYEEKKVSQKQKPVKISESLKRYIEERSAFQKKYSVKISDWNAEALLH